MAYEADDKYELLLENVRMDPVAVIAIYSLLIKPQAGICLTPLKGFEKIRELTMNTYRLHFLMGMQLERQHFHQANTLAKQARVVRVTRPPEPYTLNELADIIERDLSQCINK